MEEKAVEVKGSYSALHIRQFEFMSRLPALIQKAFELGYMVSGGDLWRHPDAPYGSKSSRHKSRLAIDLNLFKDGEYLTSTAAHQELGEWWESLGGIWGGRFNDGNHYEAPWPGPWIPHIDGRPLPPPPQQVDGEEEPPTTKEA